MLYPAELRGLEPIAKHVTDRGYEVNRRLRLGEPPGRRGLVEQPGDLLQGNRIVEHQGFRSRVVVTQTGIGVVRYG